MARIVLGIGTSHSPSLSTPPEYWVGYEKIDSKRPTDLVFPENGKSMLYDDAMRTGVVPKEVQERVGDLETFKEQHARANTAFDTLRDTWAAVRPDVTVIISDDQEEWFFENNMPALSIFWGDTAKVIPRTSSPGNEAQRLSNLAFGAEEIDVPVPAALGRHVLEYLMDHDFDVAHMTYLQDQYGGKVMHRYPTIDGETTGVLDTPTQPLGLPHGFSFVVARIMQSTQGNAAPILPIFQNTCYPPNQVRPARSYDFGKTIGDAITAWDDDIRVAVVASGGLSHFVVDEDLDRMLIDGLLKKDEEVLKSIPREKLYSAASESMNWIALGGAMAETELNPEVLDYIPVYRTPAGTGGGWTFMRWQ